MRIALYILVSLILFLMHLLIVPYLSVGHAVPDLLLVFAVYLAIREGQIVATVGGFLIGVLLDLTAGESSMLGLTALTKSVAGFLAGYFYNEGRIDQILGSSRFVLAVAVCAFAHNIIYFVVYLQGSGIGLGDAILFHAIPGMVFTSVVSLLPMFFFARKYS